MILLIDNYDSFAFNLYQLVGSVNPDIRVIRSDEMTVPEIEALAPSHIILSPGPGRPCDAGGGPLLGSGQDGPAAGRARGARYAMTSAAIWNERRRLS